MQPIFYVVEAFPKLTESFIYGKALWLLEQNIPLQVIDKYPLQREYSFFSPEQQERFSACTIGLYPGKSRLQRVMGRSLKVLEAWAYGLPRHPLVLRHFQQQTRKKSQLGNKAGKSALNTAGYQQCIDRFLNLYYALKFQPQCVHVHFGFNALDWVPVKQVLGDRMRLMVSFLGRDVTVDPRDNPQMYRTLFEVGDVFLASSSFLRDLAIQYGCPPHKIHVHPVEINTDFFYPDSLPRDKPDKLVILSVGRLVWEKDYETALRAVAFLKTLMKGKPFQYIIVGDGPLEDTLKQQIRQFGLADTVVFHRSGNRDWLRSMYWQADVFLITSVSEGLGSVVLEAQACGVPVVATRIGGLPDAVQEGETGFLAEAGNDGQIANHLLQLLNNADLRQKMGQSARQFVESGFSAKILYPRLLQYYMDG